MTEYKHDYVDDYPYICYAPETDMNINDAAGGGDLPIASDTTLGGVKIGEGINVTSDGTISASGGGGGENIINASVVDDGDYLDLVLDKTVSEIQLLYSNGVIPIIKFPNSLSGTVYSHLENALFTSAYFYYSDGYYYLYTAFNSDGIFVYFSAVNDEDYPLIHDIEE